MPATFVHSRGGGAHQPHTAHTCKAFPPDIHQHACTYSCYMVAPHLEIVHAVAGAHQDALRRVALIALVVQVQVQLLRQGYPGQAWMARQQTSGRLPAAVQVSARARAVCLSCAAADPAAGVSTKDRQAYIGHSCCCWRRLQSFMVGMVPGPARFCLQLPADPVLTSSWMRRWNWMVTVWGWDPSDLWCGSGRTQPWSAAVVVHRQGHHTVFMTCRCASMS
jgi:hypothetical protein